MSIFAALMPRISAMSAAVLREMATIRRALRRPRTRYFQRRSCVPLIALVRQSARSWQVTTDGLHDRQRWPEL